jgi:hypothetical protein
MAGRVEGKVALITGGGSGTDESQRYCSGARAQRCWRQ